MTPLVHILSLLFLIPFSFANNGKIYSNKSLVNNNILESIENYQNGSNTYLFCVFDLLEELINEESTYNLKYTKQVDDTCEDLDALLLRLSKEIDLPFHLVDDTDEVKDPGIYILDTLPTPDFIATLPNNATVTIALTTCQFIPVVPPPDQPIQAEQAQLAGEAPEAAPEALAGDNEKIRVSPLQIEQIVVIFVIVFTVGVYCLFMMQVSTPNSIKQPIKQKIS